MVNNVQKDTSYWVAPGDQISLIIPPERIVSYDLKLNVVFEDSFLAVIQKPAGLATSGNKKRTLQNALSGNLRKHAALDALPGFLPAHRLDAATEGLVIIAKTHPALRSIQKAFSNGVIKKEYHAIVSGILPCNGKIFLPLGEKKASTFFTFIKEIPHPKAGVLSLVKINIQTGRTHQIRKHFAAIGHPIIGDKLYNNEESRNFRGLHLMATSLQFDHPTTQEKLDIEIPLSTKFQKWV